LNLEVEESLLDLNALIGYLSGFFLIKATVEPARAIVVSMVDVDQE
jgi:hypothetical protein